MNYYKTIFVILFLALCSCSFQRVKDKDDGLVLFFEHPDLGVVSESNPNLLKARKMCSRHAFGKGIDVLGAVVSDHNELLSVLQEYEEIKLNLGVSVPEYITRIQSGQNKFIVCLQDEKKFKLTKSEVYDKTTGDFIYRVYH